MPSNIIKSFSDKSNKSENEVENAWNKAKKLTKEQYPNVKEDSDKFYKITVGILKKMLNINEEKTITFKEYLEEKETICPICKKKIGDKDLIKQMATGKKMCIDCLYKEVENQKPIKYR